MSNNLKLRPQNGDPRWFLGKIILKKRSVFGFWKRGIVIKIINMEGVNTMFLIEWETGTQEYLRLIPHYLEGRIWLEEEQRNVSNHMANLLLGKLFKIKKQNKLATVDVLM